MSPSSWEGMWSTSKKLFYWTNANQNGSRFFVFSTGNLLNSCALGESFNCAKEPKHDNKRLTNDFSSTVYHKRPGFQVDLISKTSSRYKPCTDVEHLFLSFIYGRCHINEKVGHKKKIIFC